MHNNADTAQAQPLTDLLGAKERIREAHWQARWQEEGLHAARVTGSAKKPYYVLEMWPYPSGDLHMGHVRNYTVGDVFARFMRLSGREVLHPMGWDAFGLPAENQAIKEGVAPQERTPQNIARMRTQMRHLGLSYDWDREQASCLADYYRWNQWFFLQMYARDLIYRRQSQVNYCPGCKTTLANEQVGDDNTCWRGHAGVTQRTIPEWAFRITAFAQKLLDGLDTLTQWPDRVVQQQRNWIGKSVGATLAFEVVQQNSKVDVTQKVEVFTTRADTLYGCTYLVLAAEHPQVEALCAPAQRDAVRAFVARVKDQDRAVRTAENTPKEGVFLGRYARHPLTGAQLPLWLANFVLADYGTGAVMAVPAHDARDFTFAKIFDLPMRQSVGPVPGEKPWGALASWTEARSEEGVLVDAGELTGLASAEARAAMLTLAQAQGFGRATTSWHLRDWGFSRQRYWGTPIPVVHCTTCGVVSVPEEDLPLQLPDFADVELTGQGGAPLGKLDAFVNTACPRCRGPARREVDTMDTFVDSSWYFARYLSPNHATAPFDAEVAKAWLPVNLYVGGPEHAVMHLLYFRFFTQVMHEMGLVPTPEPVQRLLTQGMVNAPAFRCSRHGYLWRHELVGEVGAMRCPHCDGAVSSAVEKMSKSKYNGVDPLALMQRYGADTARLYTLFAAPPEKDLEWSDSAVEGQNRFVMRLWRLAVALGPCVAQATPASTLENLAPKDVALRQLLHRTLARVQRELVERNHFNTAIAALMELTNAAYEAKLHHATAANPGVDLGVGKEFLLLLAQMLSPFAPHLAEEIWEVSGGEGLVAASRWPELDAKAAARDVVRIAVQVGGKLRATLDVAPDIDKGELLALARQEGNVAKYLDGKEVVKEVVVPSRLVNFVVRA